MAYERPSFEVARSRYSVTVETEDDTGKPANRPLAAVRYQGGIIAYFGGWGPPASALVCAYENAELRARIDSGTLEAEPTPSGLFKGPEDY
jgi:hypothetical protein